MKFLNGDKVVHAFCGECHTVRVFMAENFPGTGYWIECLICKTNRMFYALKNGRVVIAKS
jgi:hypothetical protein